MSRSGQGIWKSGALTLTVAASGAAVSAPPRYVAATSRFGGFGERRPKAVGALAIVVVAWAFSGAAAAQAESSKRMLRTTRCHNLAHRATPSRHRHCARRGLGRAPAVASTGPSTSGTGVLAGSTGAAGAISPASSGSSPYLTLSSDSITSASRWLDEPLNSADVMPLSQTDHGPGVALRTDASSESVAPSSQMTALWTEESNAYAGWSGSADTRVLGQDTWYHVSLRLPSDSYAPTTGEWNWLVEWHDDQHTAPTGAGPYSMAMGVYTDYPVIAGAVGRNPHLALRLAGGSAAAPMYQSLVLPDLVEYDHWYDLTFHSVWSTSSEAGFVEWYVDGVQVASEHFPTLFTNPDGTSSYNTFGVYNYHLACPWDSTVDYASVAIGPTRQSVGG